MSTIDEPIVVVGASQAGLYCAARLAEEGRDVVVYDQLREAGHVAERTLIVTRELSKRWLDIDAELIRNQITTFRVWTDHRFIDVPIREPDLVIERRDLIVHLARRASANGARIFWGKKLLSIGQKDGRLSLLFLDRESGTFFEESPRVVIGADGASSLISRELGCDGRPSVPILQARIHTRKRIDASTVDTWFIPERTPYFFWRIPDSDHTAAVGYVAANTSTARDEFFAFLNEHGYEPSRMEAALVPLHRPFGSKPFRKVGATDVYLVGDSAGHVKVTTVGGTVTGFAGADAAVRSILSGTDYWQELKGVRRELNVHFWIRSVLDQFGAEDYVYLLRSLNGRVLQLLHNTDRDNFAKIFPHVLLAQPRLALVGARALLRATWRMLRG